MPIFSKKTFLFLCLPLYIFSCVTPKNSVPGQTPPIINGLKFLGKYEIPFWARYQNTLVGGLSGIDYDAANNRYFIISDDRSASSPARFYTASIFLTQKGIDSVHFTGVQILEQANGKPYPDIQKDPYHTTDPEAIRYNPLLNQLTWSSEGERILKKEDTILVNPALTTVSTTGKYLQSYSLPGNLTMQAIKKGPRQNGVLEGMTFADNYTSLFVNIEEPLYEDGPAAETKENNALIRIFQYDVATLKNTRQFAYKLSTVAFDPLPAGSFKINGVTDMLYIEKNKLLVIERSFSNGRLACTVKVYTAELAGATDIKNYRSLITGGKFTPASKTLLLNMDDLGIYIDNVEGVTFGPVLANGHRTLIFITDNNFDPLQQSQLLLFEVM